MKEIALLCLIFFSCNSCTKEKDLGSLYKLFVGKWATTDPNADNVLEIKKTGKLTYTIGVQRKMALTIDYLREDEPYVVGGEIWNRTNLIDEKRNKSFLFLYNDSYDTLRVYSMLLNNSGELNTINDAYYYVRQ